jgi:diacylglycerol kinase
MNFSKSMTQSFRAAWRGLLRAFKGERTFRVMAASALMIIILVCTLPLGSAERLILLLLTGLVLSLELLNTMIERFMDLLKPRLSAYVRDVKDLMAAAVFIASFFAALIGILIFAPYVSALVSRL